MGLREIKARARRDLHERMKVPAYYYAHADALPASVFVRVHSKMDALGEVQGTSFGYAERRDVVPKILYWVADYPARFQQKGVIMISADEGYRLGPDDPLDVHTITHAATPLSRTDRLKFDAPEDGTIAAGAIMFPRMGEVFPSANLMLPGLQTDGEVVPYLIVLGEITLPFGE